jgi:hypothetical protein
MGDKLRTSSYWATTDNVLEKLAAGAGLRELSHCRGRQERVGVESFKAEFRHLANPNYAELAFTGSHAEIQGIAQAHAPPHSLYHNAICAHVCDHCGRGKSLSEGVHTPNAYWQLNTEPGGAATIHAFPPRD